MKKGFKKLLVSLGLGAMLLLGTTIAASAATEATLEAFTEPEASDSAIHQMQNEAAVPDAAYISAPSGISQTAATTTSISIKWNKVSGATKYKIFLGNFKSSSSNSYLKTGTGTFTPNSSNTMPGFYYKGYVRGTSTGCSITGLLPGKAYTIRVVAANDSETSSSYKSVDCTTLYKGANVSQIATDKDGIFTFRMKTPSPVNSITGYQVIYTNYHTKKSFTRYYNSRTSFSTQPKENIFYKLVIRPYITLDGKRYVSPTGTTKYIAQQPKLSKKGYTSSSMTIGWNKVAGATSYSVYVKYPGSSTYKKVKTTGALTYKLTNMKKNNDYLIKVIANMGSAHSSSSIYYRMRLKTA